MHDNTVFEWRRNPGAEAYMSGLAAALVAAMPEAGRLQASLLASTGSRLLDWLDHIVVADGERPRKHLAELGFEPDDAEVGPDDAALVHPGAILPRIVLRKRTGSTPGDVVASAIQVEEVAHFLMMHHLAVPIQGTTLSPYRAATAWKADGLSLLVVERRGHGGYLPVSMPSDYPQHYLAAFERWATRPRDVPDERAGMVQTLGLARDLVAEVGTDTAAWVAFAAERAHWQRRDRAGQSQRARHHRLGLGWANHDHHTFRSSRAVFPLLIEILETLGFHPRERFYAGAEAGWGAQVMEQPTCRFAVFADVDLSPDEVEGDFSHRPLPEREKLGTVGLWCALHGESMLSAGLHHLAARLDFEAATAGLVDWGIEMMRPFSEFSYLRQAFTKGARWQVSAQRLERLAAAGRIDTAQHALFAERGAIGSHLENIQRGEGFKGFNQQTISDIIRRTDPRAGFGAI